MRPADNSLSSERIMMEDHIVENTTDVVAVSSTTQQVDDSQSENVSKEIADETSEKKNLLIVQPSEQNTDFVGESSPLLGSESNNNIVDNTINNESRKINKSSCDDISREQEDIGGHNDDNIESTPNDAATSVKEIPSDTVDVPQQPKGENDAIELPMNENNRLECSDTCETGSEEIVTPSPMDNKARETDATDSQSEHITPAALDRSTELGDDAEKIARVDQSSTTETSMTSQLQQQQEKNILLFSLPIDSLHSIASFLTPEEWSRFGQCDKGTNKICNDVFRRVRMHGFRCATEVVTAFKLGQHADAKELCGLYVGAGVPIYPYSLGHLYHTLLWRLDVEAKELFNQRQKEFNEQAVAAAAAESTLDQDNTNNSGENENSDHRTFAVDHFYYDREDTRPRAAPSGVSRLTYLEEKALYTLNGKIEESEVDLITGSTRWHGPVHQLPRIPPRMHTGGPLQAQQEGHPAMIPLMAFDDASRWEASMVAGRDMNVPSRPHFARSSSFAGVRYRPRKTVLKMHRHLLDQHLLGIKAVGDMEGTMHVPRISLSSDFFHPHFSLRMGAAKQNYYRNYEVRQGLESAWLASGNADVNTSCSGIQYGNMGEELMHVAGSEGQLPDMDQSILSIGGTDDSDSDDEAEGIHPGPFVMETGENLADSGGNDQQQAAVPHVPLYYPVSGLTRASSVAVRGSGSLVGLSPLPLQNDILSNIELEVYSASSSSPKKDGVEQQSRLRGHLKTRFAAYQRLLEKHLSKNDSEGFEECILDLWDEFFPQTAYIQYYDRHTAVPRVSCLHRFMTQPCPKAVGVIQCEIERIKVGSKKKGVSMKGRFFPTYEYRLFVRHRFPPLTSRNFEEEDNKTPRRDTVLMVAKNKGRKHLEHAGNPSVPSSTKKGSNNYYLYLPQQDDVDSHYALVNEMGSVDKLVTNGSSMLGTPPGCSSLLGRLQSNFIGTEFQIFTPRTIILKPKPLTARSVSVPYSTGGGLSSDEECVLYENSPTSDIISSTRRKSRFGRLSLLGRNTSQGEPKTLLDGETPEESEVPPPLTIRRSRSSGDVTPSRKSRPSRRVSAADAVRTEQQRPSTVPIMPTMYEEEDGAITYTANLLGSRPRIMDVCIPKVNEDGAAAEWKKYLENCGDTDVNTASNLMLNHLKQLQQRGDGEDTNDNNNQIGDNAGEEGPGEEVGYTPPNDFGLLALQNRPPWWNVELGSFVLNFGGRVSVASVKNFQLCDRNDQEYIMLQFGRIQGRHSFTMDFQYPLTGVQAFAIAISSLQSKISFG